VCELRITTPQDYKTWHKFEVGGAAWAEFVSTFLAVHDTYLNTFFYSVYFFLLSLTTLQDVPGSNTAVGHGLSAILVCYNYCTSRVQHTMLTWLGKILDMPSHPDRL